MALGAPGGSFNRAYLLLCGGGLAAALVYAYKTINSDSERYERRLAAKAAEPAPRPEVAGVAEVAEVTADSVSAPADEAAETGAAAEPEACGGAAAASEEAAPPAN